MEPAQRLQRRVIDDRAARLQDAEEGDDVVRGVGQEEADMHAGAHAELLKAGGGAVGERLELRVADSPVHELQRRKRTEALGGSIQHALNGRDVERRVPPDAGRIRFDPRLSVHRPSRFLPLCAPRAPAPDWGEM